MDTCQYHPAQAATWHCPRCAKNLCMSCVVQDERSALPKCAICRSDLHTLGISQAVTPFWQRLPAFFAYGLKPSALKFILGMAVASVIAAFIPLALILVSAVMTRYLFAVTEHTAKGELEPPSFGKVLEGGGYSILFKQFAVLVFLGFVTSAVFSTLGSGAALAVYIFAVAGYPASTMLLAATHSFREAVNPVAIVQVMRGIGWPYVLLYAFLVLITFSLFWAVGLALSLFPLWLATPLSVAATLYFSVLMYNMMGYALYQYHRELGLDVSREAVMRNLGPARPAAPVAVSNALVEAEVMIKEGRYEQALQALQAAINQDLNRLEPQVRRFRLLLAMGEESKALASLDELLALLLGQRQFKQALGLLREALARRPDYRPERPDLALRLAEELHRAKEDKAALRLLLNLHKRHPGFVGVPKAYLLAAHILAERFRDDAQAMRLLEFLEAHYPQAPEAEAIAQYLKALRAVSAGA